MGLRVQKGPHLAALIFGALELVIAIVVISCSFAMGGEVKLSMSLTPYWAGLPFILPGIIGVTAGFNTNKGYMIAFMVLNILCLIVNAVGSVLLLLVLGLFSGWSKFCTAAVGLDGKKLCLCNFHGSISTYETDSCDKMSSISTYITVVISFLVLGSATALGSSIVACVKLCCAKPDNQIQVQQVAME